MNKKAWNNKAKAIVKVELAKQNIGYKELEKKLLSIGVVENRLNIANKLNRGKFSFSFALQIFKALGIKTLKLED